MVRAILRCVVTAAVALSSAISVSEGRENRPIERRPKFKIIYMVPHGPAPTPETQAMIVHSVAASMTIPLWNYSVVAYDGITYTGSLVGRSPFFHGHRSTTVPTILVPVKLTFADTSEVFDPTAADSCIASSTVDNLVLASPIFKNSDFMMNGVDVGSTQYLDAFERASFWSEVGGTPYHTVFSSSPTVLSAVSVMVPMANGKTVLKGTFGGCRDLGEMDQAWWDSTLRTTVFPSLAGQGVGTTNFPQFVFDSVAMTISGNCCALGYHSAFLNGSSVLQTYSVNDFDTSGGFAADIGVMSHEVAEWMDDPMGTNATPAWGAEGQVTAGNCQSNLEDGDPLSPGFGTATSPFSVLLSGHTYTLQELAFYSWFYGLVPSLGSGGKYSDHGTFAGTAKACPPGGTN